MVKDIVVFMTIIGSALFLWNLGKLLTNTESPIVVVMTGSMEPAFYRGDLLLVTHWKEELEVGDIVVFKVPN
jgi:signal peptidase